MAVRLGDVLVERGVLNEFQRDKILEHQKINPRPFGLLAEEMFGVSPKEVELAWAAQFARIAEWTDVAAAAPTSDAIRLIDARQAWQFGVLPLRIEYDELIVATTEDRLARALRFSGWRLSMPCTFVLCDEDALIDALARHYPMAGLNAESFRAIRLSHDRA